LVGVSTKEYGFSRLPALLAMSLGILCFVLNATWIHGQDAPGVSVDLGTSSVIHRAPVRYPEAAKKQGITGTVQVEVTLDSAGDVSDARVLTGPAELRKTALESVLSWHFTSDAARATRLITISFTDQGTQVRVGQAQEPIASTKEFLEQRQKEVENRQIEIQKAQLVVEQRAAQELKRAELDSLKRQALAAQQDAAQAELMKAAVELRNLQDGNDGLTEQRKAELEAAQVKLKVLKAQLEAEAAKQSGGGERGNPINGRTLKSISAPGLSESVRNDLISRLPVRVGDILSNKLLELTAGAVRSYDEHLTIRFLATDDGQAELRISAPGERR
jgi:TonB family protein